MLLDKISIVPGDITKQQVDAIVNAANNSLLGGGGVDGAIHQAAGPQLFKECYHLHGCATGEAKITQGYNLPAKWVIHTAGPVWRGGNDQEAELLAQCYRSCLALVEPYQIATIAFPAISTGVYHFPVQPATAIALREIKHFLEKKGAIEKVIFACFRSDVYDCYQQSLNEIFG